MKKSIILAIALLTAGLTLVQAQSGDTQPQPPAIAQGSNLADKIAWLQTFAKTGGSYIVEVNVNESVGTWDIEYSGKSDITITLRGVGTNRVLSDPSYSRTGRRSAFYVGYGVTLVLDNNITLWGSVQVKNGGTLIMNNGSTITNQIYGDYGGVYVGGGTFIMNGGTISDNTVSKGGGVYVASKYIIGERINGTFIMNGGTISGNTASLYGGGVYVESGTFTMNGGTISGNTARENGGGLYVESGTFTKTGGTITGYTGDQRNGNVVKSSSGAVQNYKGHAVYAGSRSNFKIRESTAGPEVNLSYSYDIYKEETEVNGAWDN